jgi:hypothetical protein
MFMSKPSIYAALALVVTASVAQATTPTIRFNPPTVSGAANSTVVVTMQGELFGSTTGGVTINNLSGGQNIGLSFPPGTVEIQSITILPRWNFASGTSPGTINNAAGTVTGLKFAAFPATPDDNFDIATITLRFVQPGAGTLAVTGGQFVGRVNSVNGTAIAVATVPASVTTTSPDPGGEGDVPLPAWALVMLGAGLLSASWRARRR